MNLIHNLVEIIGARNFKRSKREVDCYLGGGVNLNVKRTDKGINIICNKFPQIKAVVVLIRRGEERDEVFHYNFIMIREFKLEVIEELRFCEHIICLRLFGLY